MRLLFFVLIWASLFYSCKEVSFTVAQPAGVAALKEVPEELRGKFRPLETPSDEKKDTLIIESWGYHFKDNNDKDWLGRGTISDSLVIKFYQNYYFVNFRSGDQWVLRLIKQKPSGNLELMSIDIGADEKRKKVLKKLSKRFRITEVRYKDDTFYQINPTAAQLMQLIKEGYFTSNELKRLKK
ncbi:MAG: hypothetical protein DI538_14125 [Azospira oryzae]|jgi:hypothetical protein|nr:MAG: hypothetical protein DI538_14125 [Azospira oryzae]